MALTELIKEMEKQILKEAQRLPADARKEDSGPAASKAAGIEVNYGSGKRCKERYI